MRAHQVMTRHVITVGPETTILEAANIMLQNHISGLPVVDGNGELLGIVSEADFLRRAEIGTQRQRGRLLKFLLGPGDAAVNFVHARGRKVGEIMTPDPVTVTEETSLPDIVRLMEKHSVKRLPVMRGKQIVGLVSRSNLLQAVAALARDVPDPTADDDHIRERIINTIAKSDWMPFRLNVVVRNGVVHLDGVVTEERCRQAAVVAAENVAGVKEVHDHLTWIEPMSGFYMNSAEDEQNAKAS